MNIKYHYCTGSIDVRMVDEITSFIFDNFTKDPRTHFVLAISSSGGGSVHSFRLVDFIKTFGVQLTTIAVGDASSAASLLFLTGQKRLVTKNAIMGCHNGSYTFSEEDGRSFSHEQIRKINAESKKIDDKFNILFSELSGLSIGDVENLMDSGGELDAQRMIDLGIAHAIIPWSDTPIDLDRILKMS